MLALADNLELHPLVQIWLRKNQRSAGQSADTKYNLKLVLTN